MDVMVRRVRPDEGAVLKAIRLAALQDAPSAFGSTYGAEVDRLDDHWTQRATLGAAGEVTVTYFAVVDDRVVGLVGAYLPGSSDDAVELVSMWVCPTARRAGIAARLVDAILRWATEIASTSVNLWVTDGNDAAARLYGAAGFRQTGERQRLPSDPLRGEIRMTRTLPPPPT